MGASLVYLEQPNTNINFEEGETPKMRYTVGDMQGWRLNMVSIIKINLINCLLQEDAHIADTNFGQN